MALAFGYLHRMRLLIILLLLPCVTFGQLIQETNTSPAVRRLVAKNYLLLPKVCGTPGTPDGLNYSANDGAVVADTCNGNIKLYYNGSWITIASGGSGTVTSVGLSMPSAFTVSGSPVTTSGTLAVTGAGTTSQYIRGDGSLATFPSTGTALSGITAATATNTIDNANFSQLWQWNTFSNASTPFKISGSIGSTLDGAYNRLFEVESSGAHNASAGSRKVANISSIAIGTSTATGENIALYLKSARATNNNYALLVDSGRVGIGTLSPTYDLHVAGTGFFGGLLQLRGTSTTGVDLMWFSDEGVGQRHGVGFSSNREVQFYSRTGLGRGFTWNFGGALQTSGTNQWMKLNEVGLAVNVPILPTSLLNLNGIGGTGVERVRLYDEAGAGTRAGIGTSSNRDFQFFIRNFANRCFTWNTGGDLQTSGTNELMRLEPSNNFLSIGSTTSHSRLFVNGSVATATRAITGARTLDATDYTIRANATTAAFNVTLPTAVGISGRIYVVKKTDASANAVTVNTTSSQTIDGATTYSLATQYKYVTVQSDGANWQVIGNN